jgi:type I restriction enzyme, S subunit
MSEKLPKGWVKTTLGEVCLPVASIQPNESAGAKFTYFDIGGIDNESNRIVETKIVTGRNAPSRARQALRKDDILFSTVRTYLRKIARVERDYPNPVASTGFAVIRAAEGISSQFLFFQVLSEAFLQPVNALQTGSSYPAVRARDVFAQPILLPPAREQERIVAKLSAALSRLERGEAAARRARERVRRYRAAVVQASVTGELTRAWREARLTSKEASTENGKALLQRLLLLRRARWEKAELKRLREKTKAPKDDKWKARYAEPRPPKTDGLPKLPTGWAWTSIDQLSWASSYGTSVKCTHNADGPAVLRIPNIRSGALNFEDMKFATSNENFTDKDFVTPGDLLLIRTNGSRDLIGRAAIIKAPLRKKCSFASYLIRFRLIGDRRIWIWVALAWDSDLLRSSIESRAATTAGQYNVSLSGMSDLAVPLPTSAEQTEIIREAHRRLTSGRVRAWCATPGSGND